MIRLDRLMVERGLCASRTLAARLIEEGFVTVSGKTAKKPSQSVNLYDEIVVLQNHLTRYVSRGGLKLEAALSAFSIHTLGKRAFDFGASTGGFTDCLLAHGAIEVYAVDVGQGQLSEKLLSDSRVRFFEKTDVRTLTETQIEKPCELGVMDVSFISQSLLYESCARFLTSGADLVTLYKPQFEVGRENVGKGGIVHRKDAVEQRLTELCALAEDVGLRYRGRIESPILGGDGNREELLHFVRD